MIKTLTLTAGTVASAACWVAVTYTTAAATGATLALGVVTAVFVFALSSQVSK